jgi:hypothetical protein
MVKAKSWSTRALIGALIFSMVACGVIDTLNIVVVSADALVSALQASGEINPAQGALITTYVNAVLAGANCAATESASTDSDALKATKITECFVQAANAQALLPPGLPTVIVSAIGAVATALENYLEKAGAPVTPQTAKLSPHARPRKPQHYSQSDLAKLPELKARIAAVQARLKK